MVGVGTKKQLSISREHRSEDGESNKSSSSSIMHEPYLRKHQHLKRLTLIGSTALLAVLKYIVKMRAYRIGSLGKGDASRGCLGSWSSKQLGWELAG